MNTDILEAVFPQEHLQYCGFYIVPNNNHLIITRSGVCMSLLTKYILKVAINKIGYRHVKVWTGFKTETYSQHRLLACTFIGRPERHLGKDFNDLEVNHLDSDRANNDLKNLEWLTPKENIEHARLYGRFDDSISVLARNIITGEITEYISISECARAHDLWSTVLSKHLSAKNYGCITKNWHVFKFNDTSLWLELEFEDIVKDSWDHVVYWEATNVITGAIFLAEKLYQISTLTQINLTALKRHRALRKPHLPLQNWVYSKKLRHINDTIVGLADYTERRFPPPSDIVVCDNGTKEKFIFGSLAQASKHTGIKVGTLSYHLVKKTSCTVGNFTFHKNVI